MALAGRSLLHSRRKVSARNLHGNPGTATPTTRSLSICGCGVQITVRACGLALTLPLR